jgi:hypothetical protein
VPGVGPALATYLNDHLAGATAGAKLAERIAETSKGTIDEAELHEIAREIHRDREALIEIMRQLGVAQQPVKKAVAAMAEQASRIKLSSLGSRVPALARVLQLETLVLGVAGKQRLWLALQRVEASTVITIDVDDLCVRAEDQLRRLERIRETAVREAFDSST